MATDQHFWAKFKQSQKSGKADEPRYASPAEIRERYKEILMNPGHPTHEKAKQMLNEAYAKVFPGQQDEEGNET
jgi:hypothetical protein